MDFISDLSRGLLLERPGNLTGPKSYFESKVSRKGGRVMTSNEVNFVSLADTFTVQFLNLLKLPSGISGKQNSLTGPVITGSFEKRAPGPIENSVVGYVRNVGNFFIKS